MPRCFLKGAAPAVLSHAASALSAGTRIAWDEQLSGRARANVQRMEEAGLRVMAAGFCDLDPGSFDPEGDLLAYVDALELTSLVGRVAPEHKVLLVDTLKQKGDVVAMTGDGVNDAPSIKAAHVGIAMGSGTEVAKNAGRMIFTDDNFATIVHAVGEGRKLYDNLTKYVRFVLISLAAPYSCSRSGKPAN